MNKGTILGVNGNIVAASFEGAVFQNEVAYAHVQTDAAPIRLKGEVVRIRGDAADIQIFEDTTGLRVGAPVEFSGELLSAELGPGLLGRVFDGLQNPLPQLAEQSGVFLQRGVYLPALDRDALWTFTPAVSPGDVVPPGGALGFVPEGVFEHRIMAPFSLGEAHPWRVRTIAPAGEYSITAPIANLVDKDGRERDVSMLQRWPMKAPIRDYAQRLRSKTPLVTQVRVIDAICPVALGGAYCSPGPFGAGKTVLQQITSRHAQVDVVIIAACGERAGEVVDTLKSFPELIDPRTGKSLMERTIIICNTSSMPVAARETVVYLGATLAEYYRQMGLHALLLADSTSRWAQAMREMSGRLEEIPGEEAFPAYLESLVAAFYERAGLVKLHDGASGSVTIGGTVSPAGGNFEEPVTQATLKVVGAFHALSRARSDARRYPAIDPLESWSRYPGVIPQEQRDTLLALLRRSHEAGQMMMVVGEEGVSITEFIDHLKGEFFDEAYLQQDAFDPVDGATDAERQQYVLNRILTCLGTPMAFADKAAARAFFQRLTQLTKEWNITPRNHDKFHHIEQTLQTAVAEVADHA